MIAFDKKLTEEHLI